MRYRGGSLGVAVHEPHTTRNWLFDAYGIPRTARLSLGWTVFFAVASANLLAIPLGIYLGIWLVWRRRSVAALLIYLLLPASTAALFLDKLPNSIFFPYESYTGYAAALLAVLLWFLGALVLRRQVMEFYLEDEGTEFHLSLTRTLLFSVWYINYRLRPMWPV